ncbi:hypothetical protein A3F66_06860 [candidate division TM6 bacterium RIFCSPHIGHO2_12_FULL_32_22]|nr:MAG: hypothetical protein A3F66_06860 [candidate division TM6 bacterium RIFCSPHIGHO2_12_FULL_32_22]
MNKKINKCLPIVMLAISTSLFSGERATCRAGGDAAGPAAFSPYTPSQERVLMEVAYSFGNAPRTEKFLDAEDYAYEWNLTPRALRPYLYERLDKLQRYFPELQLEDILKLRFRGKTIEQHAKDAGYEGTLI